MVSKRTHIIHKLIAEPEYHGLSVKEAEHANDVISIKIRMDLESQLERLFNELVPENLILTVDKIEIELEEMNYEELESEYVKRVLAKVRIEILKYIPEGFSQTASEHFLYSEVLNSVTYHRPGTTDQVGVNIEFEPSKYYEQLLEMEHQTIEVDSKVLEAYYKSLETDQSLMPESHRPGDESAEEQQTSSLAKEAKHSEAQTQFEQGPLTSAKLPLAIPGAIQWQAIEDFQQAVPRITVGDLEIVIYFLQYGTYPQGVIPSDSFDFAKIIFNLIDYYPKQFYEKLVPILTVPAVGSRLRSLDDTILEKIKDVFLMEQLAGRGVWSQDGSFPAPAKFAGSEGQSHHSAFTAAAKFADSEGKSQDSTFPEADKVPGAGLRSQDSSFRELDRGVLSLEIADKIGSVLYFMNYGSLPWWNNYEDLGQLITELYRNDSELDFFKYKTNLPAHLPAFINATDGTVVRIMLERSLKSFASIVGLQQEIALMWMQKRKVARDQFDILAKQAWFFILTYFLERGFDSFDKDDFVLKSVDQLHAKYDIGKQDILSEFQSIAAESSELLLINWVQTLAKVFEPTLSNKESYLNVESVLMKSMTEVLRLKDFHYTLFEEKRIAGALGFLQHFFKEKGKKSTYDQLLLQYDQQILELEGEKATLAIEHIQDPFYAPGSAAEMQNWSDILQSLAIEKDAVKEERPKVEPKAVVDSSKTEESSISESEKVDLSMLLQVLVKVLKNNEVYAELLRLQSGKSPEISDYKFKQLLKLIKLALVEKDPDISKELLKYKLESIEKQSIEVLIPQVIKFYEAENLFELNDQVSEETSALDDYIYQLKLFVKIKLTANSTPWWNPAMAQRDLDSVLVDLLRVSPNEAYYYVQRLYWQSRDKGLFIKYFTENTVPNIRYQFFKANLKPLLEYFTLIFRLDEQMKVDSWDVIMALFFSRESFDGPDIITFWLSESLQANKYTIDQLEQAIATDAMYAPVIEIWKVMKEEKAKLTIIEEKTAALAVDPDFIDEQFIEVNGEDVQAAEILSLFVFFLQKGHLPLDTIMLPLDQFELAIKKVSLLMPEKFFKSVQQIDRNQFTQHLVFKYFSEEFYRYLLQYYLQGNAEILEKWSDLFLANSSVEPSIVRTHAIDFVRQSKQPNLVLSEYTKDLVRFILRATQSKAYQLIPDLVNELARVESNELVENILAELKQIQSQLVKIPKLISEEGAVPKEDRKEQNELKEIKEQVVTKPLFVRNAGLVLLWPFFVHFFKFNELLDKDNKFKTIDDAKRAVHLLQYLACKQTNSPEIDLTLNKVLCGLPINTPIPKSIEMNEKEVEVAESLLQACIAQWPAIKNTTPDGLRGSFLIRDGYLSTDASQNWIVKVEGKAWDILLERLNWGLSMIKLSWVKGFIYIEWRKSAI